MFDIESLLQRMKFVTIGQPLNRRDISTVGLSSKHSAGFDRLTIEKDRAGPTAAGVTPDMGTRQPQDLSEILRQELPMLDLVFIIGTVNR